jgi:diguanylate cyclase (GGDEF)-like protein
MDITTSTKGNLSRFSRYLWLTLAMFIAFAISFVVYAWAEKQIDHANEARQQSFLLAGELRQSSDDLTRMIRTYAATGDPIYKQHYQEILDIRDGRKPRPIDYQNIYWDSVQAGDERPSLPGLAIPLLTRMRGAGFTDAEFAKLAEAKANSDALTATELAAMALIESAHPPLDPSRAEAMRMLHDAAYHQAKAGIMQPIGQFYRMADQRTLNAVHAAEAQATRMRALFIVFGMMLTALLWRTRYNLHAILGGSVNELSTQIARLGSGDFSAPIRVARGMENSVLDWLSETQNKLARDSAARKVAEDRIQYLAHFDPLTGLPNRAYLDNHASNAIGLAQRNQERVALMFLDLDHFKDINDTLGHNVGDGLLVELASRLRLVLRAEDTVSRLGGDEFIFLLHGVDVHGVARVAQKVLDIIADPFRIDGHDLNVTGSMGIALYPDDGADLETLSKGADVAMYRAKQEGRNTYRFLTAEMHAHSLARSARHLQLVNGLRQGIEHGQLHVHYQPQVSMHDGRIVGAEALVRWTHPVLGAVSPAEFIPAAEYSGLILPIGEWVLRQAVRQAKAWMQGGAAPLIMAVNLSAVQFRHPDLPDLVARILDEEGLPPEYLELELTEGVAMHDPQSAIAVMDKLDERGVRMSIDDFGTRYSSLSYLKKFKVYKLKIDQSFVRDICTDPEDKAIVSAIINMARSLGLQTIAEGVETSAQLAFLREQGCDEMQGYYYCKPLPADAFAVFARARTSGLIVEAH